jgi:peptidylprolyl isomerase
MNELTQRIKPMLLLFLVCAVLIAAIAWFMNGGVSQKSEQASLTNDSTLPAPLTPEALEAYDVAIVNDMNPIAVLKTNKGTIEIELYEHLMPITAGNFKKLAQEGFYNGTKFHRVIDGFMIQGGDPLTKTAEVLRYGTGGPDYTIPDEHIKHDLLSNVRGTISMANSGPNSGGSQFFINLIDNTNLDFDKPPLTSKHPVFGRVISGMEVVDGIAKVSTNQVDLPLEDVVVESVEIRLPQ